MNRDSVLEIQHKREQSYDSGTYQDWTLEDPFTTPVGHKHNNNNDFVTVVAVDEKPFVTVLNVDSYPPDSEEVLVYRLPGERLGFGLKFEGGVKTAETVKKLLIQSCADDSPASRTRASWGPLAPGDEILVIDSVPVSEMTRMDCVRNLKESNVVIKLRVRKGPGMLIKEEDREAPPIPPRKYPRKKDLAQDHNSRPVLDDVKNSPPLLPRSRMIPQPEIYTDLLSQECVLPESESDDTGSSISTVVSRVSSTPTTRNSSFSDGRVPSAAEMICQKLCVKPSAYDLDMVLEPFLHLEREFSSASLGENSIYQKLAQASKVLEDAKAAKAAAEAEIAPKPAPRHEKRRPPPPPPPRIDRQPLYPDARSTHLPRLIDFVPKDRTDVVIPSPLVPLAHPAVPPPPPPIKMAQALKPPVDLPKPKFKESIMEAADQKKPGLDLLGAMPKEIDCPQLEKTPPSDLSRLPPDGHEFPPDVSKTNITAVPIDSKSLSTTCATNKEIKPKSISDTRKISNETKYSWRNDEKSEKSVKDKIAMFSNAQNNSPPQAAKISTMSTSTKLMCHEPIGTRLSNVDNNEKTVSSKPIASIKKSSLPYKSLFDISGSVNDKKDSLQKDKKTKSTHDLTENADSEIPPKVEYSTLPRKSDSSKYSQEQKLNSSTSPRGSRTRALSFSEESKLHTRSQSLIDVGSKDTSIAKENEEQRKTSLANWIEHRRKGYSKLRGLVIPEKVVEIPTTLVEDLPVIKSSDCHITENGGEKDNIKSENEEAFMSKGSINNHKPPIDKTLMPSPLWKTETNCEVPKYSPAFKRKSLSLYGTSSSVSSVSSSLSSSREELRTCFNDSSKISNNPSANITTSLANLSHNSSSTHTEPKSLESITSSSISDVSNEYNHGSESPNLNNGSEVLSSFKYNESYSSDTKQSKDVERGLDLDSDNDSAVSSSRSSISPPHSPISDAKKNDDTFLKNNNHLKLKRTLSFETSDSSSGSTVTSGSESSSSSGCCTVIENKRILKAQSIEAINRKNVLISAKFSSGIGAKGEVTNDQKTSIKLSDNKTLKTIPNIDTSVIGDTELNKENMPNIAESEDSNRMHGPENPSITNKQTMENKFAKNHEKRDTALNTDNFTYNSDKSVDTKSNGKVNDDSDFPDGAVSNDDQNKLQSVESNTSGDFEYPTVGLPNPQLDTVTHEKQQDDKLSSPTSISVSAIKKVFEKSENIGLPNGRLKINIVNQQIPIQHPRVSSVDSTTSDEGYSRNPSHHSSSSNLDQFGSITSLASTTTLISPEELSQLIEEANATLEEEEEGNCHEIVVALLHRDAVTKSVGIALAGGSDCEAKEITVHKVLTDSPAERDGRIRKGDRVLSINGKQTKGMSHNESVATLKHQPTKPEVVLVVSRLIGEIQDDHVSSSSSKPSTSSYRSCEHKLQNSVEGKECKWGPPETVTLMKHSAGLGFSLDGGKNTPTGDHPITIKKIFQGGIADRCGQLFVGDRIMSVNHLDVNTMTRVDAWHKMTSLPNGEINIVIRRPLPPLTTTTNT